MEDIRLLLGPLFELPGVGEFMDQKFARPEIGEPDVVGRGVNDEMMIPAWILQRIGARGAPGEILRAIVFAAARSGNARRAGGKCWRFPQRASGPFRKPRAYLRKLFAEARRGLLRQLRMIAFRSSLSSQIAPAPARRRPRRSQPPGLGKIDGLGRGIAGLHGGTRGKEAGEEQQAENGAPTGHRHDSRYRPVRRRVKPISSAAGADGAGARLRAEHSPKGVLRRGQRLPEGGVELGRIKTKSI